MIELLCSSVDCLFESYLIRLCRMSSPRLCWLMRQVEQGRSGFVSFPYSADTKREKVKFTLGDTRGGPLGFRPVIKVALSAVHDAISSCIVTDKGHKSTSQGHTVVAFRIQQPLAGGDPDAVRIDRANSIVDVNGLSVDVSDGAMQVVDADIAGGGSHGSDASLADGTGGASQALQQCAFGRRVSNTLKAQSSVEAAAASWQTDDEGKVSKPTAVSGKLNDALDPAGLLQ